MKGKYNKLFYFFFNFVISVKGGYFDYSRLAPNKLRNYQRVPIRVHFRYVSDSCCCFPFLPLNSYDMHVFSSTCLPGWNLRCHKHHCSYVGRCVEATR